MLFVLPTAPATLEEQKRLRPIGHDLLGYGLAMEGLAQTEQIDQLK